MAWHSAPHVVRTAQLSGWMGILLCLLLAPLGAGCATYRKSRDGTNVVAARQLTLRGLDSLQQNHWSVAETMFREAVEASPHDEEAHCHYAKTLWHRQAVSEALQHMSEAVRLSGGSPDRLVELGEMHLALGHVAEARQQAEQAVATDPQHAAAHALYGDVLRQQGSLQLALQQYHWSLDIDDAQPQVKIAVAEIYQQMDEPRRAIASLQSVAVEQISDAEAGKVLWLRGLAHKELGHSRDAIQCLADLHARQPDDARVLCQLAEAHFEAGEIPVARELAALAYRRAPTLVDAQRLMARLDEAPSHVARAER